MSRPWAVRAQITATAMAIMIELHTGWMGSHTKLATALPRATNTPTVRASTLPEKMPRPARKTRMPMIRWIQPHWVVSSLTT